MSSPPTRPPCRPLVAALLLTGAMLSARTAVGAPDTPTAETQRGHDRVEPEQAITGVAEPGREPGDDAREVGSALLWAPRNLLDLMFRGTAAAARYVADEQLVPRYRKLLGAPPGGDVLIFPTLFAETGSPFNVGVRLLADSDHVTTYQRFGYGIPGDVVTESRVIFKGGKGLPLALSVEAYAEHQREQEYWGVGLVPELDTRNHYRYGTGPRVGLYSETHTRGIGSLGMRLWPEMELFLSASLGRRLVYDTPGAAEHGLGEVFDTNLLPGSGSPSFIGYAEMAARFDTREFRGKPNPGAVVEAYVGGAHSTEGPSAGFMRLGWRVEGFISIYRKRNILAPKLVVDRLLPLNSLPVPFNELPRQPEFRGFDTRRDKLSMVASLDYSWELVPFMGLRLFIDAASVAPSASELSLEQIESLRYAAGVGIDLYSDKAELARIALATSPEGVRLLLSIGEVERFGDRQHRE